MKKFLHKIFTNRNIGLFLILFGLLVFFALATSIPSDTASTFGDYEPNPHSNHGLIGIASAMIICAGVYLVSKSNSDE